jgi:hypothetical protein
VDSSYLDSLSWRRSSRCNGGSCVEVAELDSVIMIRDSAEPGNTPIIVSRDAWLNFVLGVRIGLFQAD